MVKKILIFSLFFCAFSCSKGKDDPLTLPPNFAEMPDPNNPEKPSAEEVEENVSRLKDLLIKSEE
ncbi:MAG: hypothetical protein KGP29_01570 [Proteobacteria bacterium]|nr:hypothetical protein [Pseudomonadota bacterium]